MQADEKIGPYRLIELLGSGGMGTVWRAWDERLKRPVALKRILAATKDPKARERFRREAEAGARLNHPSIVHLYDIVEMDESDWIVMELVNGRTLQDLLREGPLEVPRALRLGREIADGLAEAHAQGFLHRDLKAPNVMVTPAGRAKILDFGVVKQIQPEAQDTTLAAPGSIIGTSYAMSPEQVLGGSLDTRSDLFSLGSLLYEMVTGVVPFRADTVAATLARVCNFRQRPASTIHPGLPPELSDLIDRLLEKEPVERPASAAEVAAALDRIAAASAGTPAGAQASPGEAVPPDPATVVEAPPAGPVPAEPSLTLQGPPSLTILSLPEPAPPSGPARASGGASRRAWTRWAGAGIAALLLAVTVAAAYLLGSPALPLTPHALYQQGMASLDRADRKGNLDHAIDRFERVLAEDESHAAAHAGLAKAYWLKLQSDSRDPIWRDRALSMAQRAVDLDPYLAAAQVGLGLALGSAGRHEEALRHIEQALVLEPRNGDAFYAAGRIYESQGEQKKAEAAYRKAVEIQPHRMYLDELGSLYLRMGRTEEAIRIFRRSIEIAPDGFIGYRNLGTAYYMQGDLAETASNLQKALQIRADATLYANLGTVQFAQGFYRQSAEAFEKALDMPGGANNYLVWGNLGDACRWTPDNEERSREAYQRAIQLLHEQLRLTPDDPTLRTNLALYLAKRGDLPEALAALQKVERLPGKDASCWFQMAIAYEVCARRGPALAALGSALRAGLPVDEVRKDPELLDLRADARYHRLVAGLAGKS
jgi:eukaryotic-like serine/threonine-protein kinase